MLGNEGAAGKLRRSGAIRDVRGKISVLDRSQPERCSRECYAVVRKETDRLSLLANSRMAQDLSRSPPQSALFRQPP